jgi:hypothetical protein
MPFTVEDFEDLLRLLYEKPEWQERLRHAILPPELFELPRIAQELAEVNRAERERVARIEAEQQATRQDLREGFTQTGERLDRVENRLDGVETDLAAFRTETNERFDRVDRRFDRMDANLQRVSQDVGDLKGDGTEDRYRANVAWFRHILPKPGALSTDEVARFLDDEVAAGRLLPGESRCIERADVIMRGGEPHAPAFLVVEVSWQVNERDVRRAIDRASLLRKAGYEAHAAVAGRHIQEDARLLADRLGVGRVIDDEREAEDVADDDRI